MSMPSDGFHKLNKMDNERYPTTVQRHNFEAPNFHGFCGFVSNREN